MCTIKIYTKGSTLSIVFCDKNVRKIPEAKNLLTPDLNPLVYVFAADVAELADAQASGACGRKAVKVRFLSSAFSRLFRS
jgi:hypothetical protein